MRLIETVRTEQVGRRPERTVYQVTAERQRLEARGYISGLQAEIMRRGQIHLEAEGSTLGGHAAPADNQPPTED
jgi:hypothetical protein